MIDNIMFIGRYSKGSSGSAGIDLYATEGGRIEPQQTKVIDVGLRWEVGSEHYVFAVIKDRSSMAAKGLRVGGGVVDPDYRGPIKVVMTNHSFIPYTFEIGDRIAQMIVMPFIPIDGASGTVTRGTGGFGSTGV